MRVSLGELIIVLMVLSISCVCAFLIVDDVTCPEYYNRLWLLPLISGLIISGLLVVYSDVIKDIRATFIVALFGLRNIITPLIMRYGDYCGIVPVKSSESVNYAIALMLFETVIVLIYSVQKSYRSNDKDRIEKDQGFVTYSQNSTEKFLLFGLVCASAILLIINPRFLSDYVSLFSSKNIRLTTIGLNNQGVLYTLFTVIFPISYMFLCSYIIGTINKGYRKIWKSILSIFVMLIPFLFMNNSDLLNVICVVCIAMLSIKTGALRKRTVVIGLGLALFIIVVYIQNSITSLSVEAQNRNMLQNLSASMQAYMPGVCNVAGTYNIDTSVSKITSIFYDFYMALPFRSTLFGFLGINNDYRAVVLFCTSNGVNSQIIPSIGQLYYYFSVFAPFIECIFIKFAFNAFEKMKYAMNDFEYLTYGLLFIYMAITPIMYNFTIALQRFLITILPMIIICKIINYRNVSDRYTR